jgi:hypothetical protein
MLTSNQRTSVITELHEIEYQRRQLRDLANSAELMGFDLLASRITRCNMNIRACTSGIETALGVDASQA